MKKIFAYLGYIGAIMRIWVICAICAILDCFRYLGYFGLQYFAVFGLGLFCGMVKIPKRACMMKYELRTSKA